VSCGGATRQRAPRGVPRLIPGADPSSPMRPTACAGLSHEGSGAQAGSGRLRHRPPDRSDALVAWPCATHARSASECGGRWAGGDDEQFTKDHDSPALTPRKACSTLPGACACVPACPPHSLRDAIRIPSGFVGNPSRPPRLLIRSSNRAIPPRPHYEQQAQRGLLLEVASNY
jgi:hypothetical protein